MRNRCMRLTFATPIFDQALTSDMKGQLCEFEKKASVNTHAQFVKQATKNFRGTPRLLLNEQVMSCLRAYEVIV